MGTVNSLAIQAQHYENTSLKLLQRAYDALLQVQYRCWPQGEGEDAVYAPDVEIAEQLREMQLHINNTIDEINKARLELSGPALKAN